MKIKRIMALVIVGVFIMGIPMSYGTTLFTDVPEDHWGNKYIASVVDKKIMSGFEDATYKPNNPVSKLEVIVALYNMVVSANKFDSTKAELLVKKHKQQIESAHIPSKLESYGDVVFPAVAFALENHVIHIDELKGFVVDEKIVEATKLETTIFIGKTMNIYLKENLERIIFFEYNDTIKIPTQVAAYVDMLIQHKILSKKGDKNRNFNPDQTVSRVNLATMLSAAYNDIISSNSIRDDEANIGRSYENGLPLSDKTYEGIISIVHTELGVVEIRDGAGNPHTYDGGTAIYEKDGENLSFYDLADGMDVVVKEQNGKLSKVIINKQFDKVKGFLLNKSEVMNDSDGEYQIIAISTDDGKKYCKIYDNAVVMKNGRVSKRSELSDGDQINASVDGYLLRQIEAYSETSTVEAILNRDSTFKKGDMISAKLIDGGYIDQKIDNNIKIIGDDGVVKKGDMINLTLSYGKVTQIEDTGISSELKGIVKSILIGDNSHMVLDVNSKIKTVLLTGDVSYVLSDGEEEGSIYDLRLNQTVMVSIDVKGSKTISLTKPTVTKKWSGKIEELFPTSNLLKVVDNKGTVWTVTISENSEVNLMKYKKGDMVLLVGKELSSDVFMADLVVFQ